MDKKTRIICIIILLVAITACTPSQQNPQDSPAPTIQPTSAPTQQGALPDVDYSIPNGPARGSDLVTDGKKLFVLINGYGIISINLEDGFEAKLIQENTSTIILNFHKLSYADGWLYYFAPDGIYKIKPDGQDNTKMINDNTIICEEDRCKAKMSQIVGESLYYCYDQNEDGNIRLYRIDPDGRKSLITNFEAYYPEDISIYDGSVYHISKDEVLIKTDLSNGKNETVLTQDLLSDGSRYRIVNNTIYFIDNDSFICMYDLITKKKDKLQKLNSQPYSVVQFHNLLIYFYYINEDNLESEISCFDTNTNKTFPLDSHQYSLTRSVAYAGEDFIYIMDTNSIYKLYFEQGKAKIDFVASLSDY